MNEIIVCGYPRSGTTWATRLLSDLLDSPIQGQEIDRNHCQTGTGGYIIRKTHWQAHEWDGRGKVVFIQRDPRDVAVSAMFYLDLEPTDDNLLRVITAMVEQEAASERRYQIYHRQGFSGCYELFIRGWTDSAIQIKYESLHGWTTDALCEVYWHLTGGAFGGVHLDPTTVKKVVDRQRFDLHQANHPHSLRKGAVGNWKVHFEQAHGRLITERLGALMLEQGYIGGLGWWKEL